MGATALYQIWAGSKQKELGLGSMQLLHQYVPLAAMLLGILVSSQRHSAGTHSRVVVGLLPCPAGDLAAAAACAACSHAAGCVYGEAADGRVGGRV